MRPPAGARDCAARVLQRRQEFVPDERVVAGETVPFVRGHGIERIDHMYFDLAVQQAYLASGLFGLTAERLMQRGTVILAEVAGFCSEGVCGRGLRDNARHCGFRLSRLFHFSPCPGFCTSSNAPTEVSIRGLLPMSRRGLPSMSAAMARDIPDRASPWPCALRSS